MATPVIRYVDPDAVGVPINGVNWNQAYRGLEACNIAEAKNLVTADETITINCRASGGSNDGAAVYINGWTTNATHTITIQVAPADRHSGVRGSGYHIEHATAWKSIIRSNEQYVTIDGVCGKATSMNATPGFYSTQPNVNIKNCFAYDCNSAGFSFLSETANTICENNIAVKNGTCGFETGTMRVFHCTSCNNTGNGFFVNQFKTMTAKNCYAGGNSGNDYGGDGTLNTTTCHDSDGTADITTAYSKTPNAGTMFTEIAGGSEVLTIANGASGLIGVGTGGVSIDDFEGDIRDVSNPDIGADEYITEEPPEENPVFGSTTTKRWHIKHKTGMFAKV